MSDDRGGGGGDPFGTVVALVALLAMPVWLPLAVAYVYLKPYVGGAGAIMIIEGALLALLFVVALCGRQRRRDRARRMTAVWQGQLRR